MESAHIKLYQELVQLYHSLDFVVSDVLGLDREEGKVWYWVYEDEGENVAKNRINKHGNEIARVLNLHEKVLNDFGTVENLINYRDEKAYSSIRELIDDFKEYVDAVDPISIKESVFNEEDNFLGYPCTSDRKLSSKNKIDAEMTYAYLIYLLNEVKNGCGSLEEIDCGFNFVKAPYRGGDGSDFWDSSARGRLLFVKKHLETEFGLKFDSVTV